MPKLSGHLKATKFTAVVLRQNPGPKLIKESSSKDGSAQLENATFVQIQGMSTPICVTPKPCYERYRKRIHNNSSPKKKL